MKSKIPAVPYLIWMVLFTVIPLALVVVFAFTNQNGDFTTSNLYAADDYLLIFGRSLWLAFVSTVICLLIAYPFAYIISKPPFVNKGIFYMLAVLPMWMNFLLRTYSWMSLLEKNGLINKFFSFFGLGPFEMINTQGAVVLGMVYDYIPFMILPLYSVMVKIEDDLINAAQDLGANTANTFIKIIIPLTKQGIQTGIIMVFIPAVSTFIISRMLGGSKNMLIGDLIEMQFLGNAYNPNLGSAIAVVLMVIVLLTMSITNVFEGGDEVGEMIK